MKLTWFGGTAMRIYLGGQIVVVDAESAPQAVDRLEILAGLDRLLRTADATVPKLDPGSWRRRPPPRAIDEIPTIAVEVQRLDAATLVLDMPGEPPLVIVGPGAPPPFGRWADGAVVTFCLGSENPVSAARTLLADSRPKLLAIAAGEALLDAVIPQLREHLDGAGLVALEPGLALEV